MMSRIIIGGSANERKEKTELFCEQEAVNTYDRQIFSISAPLADEKGSAEEKFGIAMVRRIKKQALLKPAYSQHTAIIILEAQQLTHPAQQALLKFLEEPPTQSIILLTADRASSMLPTILSRCQLIKLNDQEDNDEDVSSELHAVLNNASLSHGERMELAEIIAKNDPVLWIKNYIVTARRLLLTHLAENNTHAVKKLSHSLTAAQEAYQTITTTNSNQRLVLEHFFFSI
ncbi:MAG: hypothetical protein RLZZ455_1160 [Candidatus Parcubacteria bacterium]|jgi:replication-associated recombination protein RarA